MIRLLVLVAIIAILTQIGCFVPAQSANMCVVDAVFTRVGASDDLASGQSTFMVEMNETSYILNSATEKSLILLDFKAIHRVFHNCTGENPVANRVFSGDN